MLRPALLFLAFAFATSLAAQPSDEWPPRPVHPSARLTSAQREQLNRDKLIIGPDDYRQIFTPYIALGKSPESIRFITSDAALAAYHALFEDSFRELELRRAVRLRGDLEKLYAACRHEREKNADVPELIQHILGPALIILGMPATPDNFAPALLPEIKRQASLISAADTSECPPWLDYHENPFFKIDYRRCKPVSFYAGNPTLENYHRVVRWLQMAPLRTSNDKELTAWVQMTNAVSPAREDAPDFQESFKGLGDFVGPIDEPGIVPDDPRISYAAQPGYGHEDSLLPDVRAALLTASPQKTSLTEIRLHVMPTYILPDALIMLRSLENNIRPNGLTVAAFLGSSFARERMPQVNPDKWSKWDTEADMLARYSQSGAPRSLYADYVELLKTLNAPPVKEAPAFMNSLPWQAKTCLTQLASWAQMRHTFALQAKVAIYTTGVGPQGFPPGFIEPNPAFWREYVRFIERTIYMLEAQNVFTRSPAFYADEIRRSADKIESFGLHLPTATSDTLKSLEQQPGLEWMSVRDQFTRWLALTGAEKVPAWDYSSAQKMRSDYAQAIIWLRTGADKVERGERVIEEKYYRGGKLAVRWQQLAVLARQLERILAKQLAESELTEYERDIIISFGDTLAECMGFFGDSKHMWPPPDTAPRWVEVAHDTLNDQSLAAATGRARALYVLYPWRGRELLCTGAVLSYYEEWAPTTRLTDDEWKQKLDSANPPPPPAWLAPILAK